MILLLNKSMIRSDLFANYICHRMAFLMIKRSKKVIMTIIKIGLKTSLKIIDIISVVLKFGLKSLANYLTFTNQFQ